MQVQEFKAWLVSSSEKENLEKNEAKTHQLSHTQLRGPAFSLNKSPTELCWGGSSAPCCTRCLWRQTGDNRADYFVKQNPGPGRRKQRAPWALSSQQQPQLLGWTLLGPSTFQSRIFFQEEHLIQNKTVFHVAFATELQCTSYPHFFSPTDTFSLSLFIFQARHHKHHAENRP